ncbi:MAG: hypothetical protein GY851_17215, partial [bacterium]|nr:hypothetical protein [bacterium]
MSRTLPSPIGRRALRGASTLALTLLVLAGCATSPNRSQYVRNGVQYGVTEGTFRGRWWNFYERGRSFSDGRFW